VAGRDGRGRPIRIPRFGQRSLYGLSRRLGAAFRRLAQNRFVRAKRTRVVMLSGRPYKRLSLPDSALAAQVASNLATFRHAGVFPAVVAVLDDELLLEFVAGRPLAGSIPLAGIDRLARFYGTLYACERRCVPLTDTTFGDDLQRDLAFLEDVGILTAAARRDLAAAAAALAPPEVWVGWDYLDPLPRNFVATRDGRLVAVDVEDLRPDQLLGSGVAKACFRSLAPGVSRERLLAAVARESGLDLAPAMPFVELHFLADWTKVAYLKGRARLVQPALFEPYRAKPVTSTARPLSMR